MGLEHVVRERFEEEFLLSDLQRKGAIRQYCVRTALDRLRVYLNLPRSPQEAIDMFWRRFEYGLFVYLYRTFFPDDYTASQESNEIDESWSYSPREVEFLYLVTDRLFPLDIDFISEAGVNGDRATEMIYLEPYEMPWWDEEFENLSPGWQMLRLLSGTLTDQEAPQLIAEMEGLPPYLLTDLLAGSQAIAAAPLSVQYKACTFFLGQDHPGSKFGQVLALYQRKTGNPWLDTDSEHEILYEGYCWCEKHVREIAQTYQAAQVYEEQVNAFAHWLEEDTSRIKPLVEMLLQIVRASDQRALASEGRTNYGQT